MGETGFCQPLTEEMLDEFQAEFSSSSKNILAQNMCSHMDINVASISSQRLEDTQHVFTHNVDLEGRPVANQRSTGRCWIFACINAMRIPFMRHYGLDQFEFSAAYLFYWDKLERCRYFLHNVVEIARLRPADCQYNDDEGVKPGGQGDQERRQPPADGNPWELNSRLMLHLLKQVLNDGGQWSMVTNLINKHGVMPKKAFPETVSGRFSIRMNVILRSKLREYSKELRAMVFQSKGKKAIEDKIKEQMSVLFRIVNICLGTPPEDFTWEYQDGDGAYRRVGPVTPLDFYEKCVKPLFNVCNKACFVNDPRPNNPYGKVYTVAYLGNVAECGTVLYNNQPIEFLMRVAVQSIRNNEPVWFGCEVSKRFASNRGIMDTQIHDYELLFDCDFHLTLTKAESLSHCESKMTHAMVFTGVSLDGEGQPVKWRVENSWGKDRGDNGYLVMTNDWFKEFVFEIVVDKKYVPGNVMQVFNTKPRVLPAWDPMGTLAAN